MDKESDYLKVIAFLILVIILLMLTIGAQDIVNQKARELYSHIRYICGNSEVQTEKVKLPNGNAGFYITCK